MASRKSRSSSRKPLTSQAPALPQGTTSTAFNEIQLDIDRDNNRRLTVLLNGAPSSFIDLDDPSNVVFEYMEIFLTIIAQLPQGPIQVTHLGSAASTVARAIEFLRPNSRQIGVDIDQELLDFSRTWFDLPKSPRLRLRGGDARVELEKLPENSQDVIIRDVFSDAQMPRHLQTYEYVELLVSKLKPGGIYLVNCADKPPLKTARSEMATLIHSREQQNKQDELDRPASAFMISEPGILKGRRYGNLVLGLSKSVPEINSPGSETRTAFDCSDAFLARKLRSLAVPAHILIGEEVDSFAGTAPIISDETSG